MSVLSPEEITSLMAQTRNRGGHERFVRKFIASEAMYWVVNHDREYQGKSPSQLSTGVKQGILNALAKVSDHPTIKCVMNGDDLLIVNADLVAANLPTE